ncbi:MAG: protein phosphatase [Paraglaciecola sp.]|jgi:protein phosphatase|uniref:PP2C family protein-serine/threonine phosphatase n=1 Tax=Polaribacter sp. TaxID=1920175 RepID=UPI003AC66A7B
MEVGNKSNYKFNISGFTDIGTVRKKNQDGILVNGQFSDTGFINQKNCDFLSCFVADGVGGNKSGEFASKFVLESIQNIETENLAAISEKDFKEINNDLISITKKDQKLIGSATTLSGIIYFKSILKIIHSGDSEIWLLRNDSFIKITNDQVLNNKIDNSPITSYYGGKEDYLTLDKNIYLEEIMLLDKFLICSDGLFKAMNPKQIKSILDSKRDLDIKIKKILDIVLENGAEDNVSVLLIETYQ